MASAWKLCQLGAMRLSSNRLIFTLHVNAWLDSLHLTSSNTDSWKYSFTSFHISWGSGIVLKCGASFTVKAIFPYGACLAVDSPLVWVAAHFHQRLLCLVFSLTPKKVSITVCHCEASHKQNSFRNKIHFPCVQPYQVQTTMVSTQVP